MLLDLRLLYEGVVPVTLGGAGRTGINGKLRIMNKAGLRVIASPLELGGFPGALDSKGPAGGF